MDEEKSVTKLGEVCCRNLAWCLDFCEEKNLDMEQVLHNVDVTIETLKDPSQFIDWRSFVTFCDNFSPFLDESEIKQAGLDSWRSKDLRVYRLVGLLYNVKEQYLSVFGPAGKLTDLYPCTINMIELSPGHLNISLRMRAGLPACKTFQTTLAGQMAGLPSAMGHEVAKVVFSHNPRGADYDVNFPVKSGIFAPIRRAIMRHFTLQDSAHELEAAYHALQTKYRELNIETERSRQAEQLASKNLQRYKLLADNTSDVIWTSSLQPQINYVSPSIVHLLGYTETEVRKLGLSELLPATVISNVKQYLQRALSSHPNKDEAHSFESLIYRKDGTTVWIEGEAKIEFDADNKAFAIVGVARDISRRRRIQDKLQLSEAKYRAITDTALDAIFIFSDDGHISFANPSSHRIFGYQSGMLIGKAIKTLIPEAYDRSTKELEHLDNETLNLSGWTQDKQKVDLEISFARYKQQGLAYFIGIARDISARMRNEKERARLQNQLLAAQKMESIGQLTGGIAHDFNNLLVAINGYAELGRALEPGEVVSRTYFDEILQAGERAADMTQKLLAFSRRQIIEPSVLDLCSLIDGLGGLLQRLIPENIKIDVNYSQVKILIKADAGQVEQVLINLAVNARDAMPSGGLLRIQCATRELSASESEILNKRTPGQDNELQPGNYALITVSDDGCGMSRDVKKRIFEPFFTTKLEGSGTGLGMAVVFGIIKQHGGFIEIESEQDKGSRLSVYLPISEEPLTPGKRKSNPKVTGGNETILMAEDNRQVRDLGILVLEKVGFQVISAADGQAALDIYKLKPNNIDLVILDVVMPKMGGYEVYQQMLKINPRVKVIFTSGYSEQGIHTDFILEQGLAFLQKPYQTHALQGRVRSVLDGRSELSQDENSPTQQ